MVFRCCFIFALITFMVINVATISGYMMLGGWTGERKANDHIQSVAEQVESAVKLEWEKLCKINDWMSDCDLTEYKAVSYRSQVVAGTNYIIKIQVRPQEEGKFIVIKVFVPLPYTHVPPMLKGVEPYYKGMIGYELFQEH